MTPVCVQLTKTNQPRERREEEEGVSAIKAHTTNDANDVLKTTLYIINES